MAIVEEVEYEKKNQKVIREEEEEKDEKWLKHYSSFHEILLVGEGDFSFSLCLAKSFGSASNMVATSLDSYDVVIRKYKNAKPNLEILKELGAYILHGVDATKMKLHTDLRMRKFDRIIFNFPHAGFHGKEDEPRLIMKHRNLVHGFFRNSSSMLRANGEVHVNHKTTPPFCNWNLGELAGKNSLLLTECVDFKIEDYPGYSNKRGDSSRCDEPFPLGESSTFKFRFSTAIKRKNRGSVHAISPEFRENFANRQQQAILLNRQPSLSSITCRNVTTGIHVLPMHINIRNECFRIFYGYFNHVVETFGRTDYDVSHHVHEALRLGFERYIAEDPGRPMHYYINILEELHHISVLRSTWLRAKLRLFDLQL